MISWYWDFEDGYYELPGPAWFQDDFDKIGNSWVSDLDPQNAETAYRLVTNPINTINPSQQGLLAPSHTCLFMWQGELATYLAQIVNTSISKFKEITKQKKYINL